MTDQAVSRVSSMQLGAPSGSLAIVPQNFGELIAFADRMAESQFVPAHLRRKPGDCMAVCLQALRWGMDPFMVAQKSYVVRDGATPAYEAQLIAAVIYSRAPLNGRLDIEWSGDAARRICTVTGRIIGDPKPKVRRVDSSTITTRNSPLWKSDLDQQLAYYSVRAWARLYCPDVIMGVFAPDEIRSSEAIDVTPADAAPVNAATAVQSIITQHRDEPSTAGTGGSAEEAPPAAETTHDAATGEVLEAHQIPVGMLDGGSAPDWAAWCSAMKAAIGVAEDEDALTAIRQQNGSALQTIATGGKGGRAAYDRLQASFSARQLALQQKAAAEAQA